MKALAFALALLVAVPAGAARADLTVREFRVPAGSHPHDVAPAPGGAVWYTAQAAGKLGRLDPATGKVLEIPLGAGSAPHGVIVGPDGAPWITDGGLNAIVRVDPNSYGVRRFPLPHAAADANLNTAVFDRGGVLWFTGQRGVYGRVDPRTSKIDVFRAPGGPWAVRDRGHARGIPVLRVARREPHRAHRPAHGPLDDPPPADARPGRSPDLVGLQRPPLVQ
jgi:virginiamycin B lyase